MRLNIIEQLGRYHKGRCLKDKRKRKRRIIWHVKTNADIAERYAIWGLGIVPIESVYPYPPEFILRKFLASLPFEPCVSKDRLFCGTSGMISWYRYCDGWPRSKDSETSGRGRRSHRKRSSILPFSFKKPSVSREDDRCCIPLYIEYSRKPRSQAYFIKSGEESGTSRQQRPTNVLR